MGSHRTHTGLLGQRVQPSCCTSSLDRLSSSCTWMVGCTHVHIRSVLVRTNRWNNVQNRRPGVLVFALWNASHSDRINYTVNSQMRSELHCLPAYTIALIFAL